MKKIILFNILFFNLIIYSQQTPAPIQDKSVLIFGATAITDIDDIVPKSIRKNDGRVTRLGMPVEPGNLMLLGNLK